MWYQNLTKKCKTTQIVNDSKTPSGRVHVGSLRGVLIHDAIHRSLKHQGIETKYLYGFDDYDPMDGLPADAEESLRKYMAIPLCNIPAPQGSQASDLADHYSREFIEVFTELGVDAQIYRTRDLYRQGIFNQAITTILENTQIVRQIYKQVSGSEKPDDWYPFQVICESCGKVGTTRVYAYRDGQVSYKCEKNAVSWAQGCGKESRVVPLNGAGKLSWKLEWVAKWVTLGVTIEGAGKDHSTKGGARDVATKCLQRIFKRNSPDNIPYEFFLIKGAKMSSSKGVGISARQMADFLPPALLRYLMIRTAPKRSVNFSTDLDYIVKLYNEYDRIVSDHELAKEQESMLGMIQPHSELPVVQPVGFQLITALLQLPHINVEAELNKRYQLKEQQCKDLQQRIASASYWLEHLAEDKDRVRIQQKIPEAINTLSNDQKALLYLLGNSLKQGTSDDECQQLVFDCARLIPMNSKKAFQAIYVSLLDSDRGPKVGSLLAYLDHDFLTTRLTSIEPDLGNFLQETTENEQTFSNWCTQNAEKIKIFKIGTIKYQQIELIQLKITLNDQRKHIFRLPKDTTINLMEPEVELPITITDWKNDWHKLTSSN